ncbi:MAG: porin [Rhodospirillaceae bacterium]|jgi:outer membrane protein OmpU
MNKSKLLASTVLVSAAAVMAAAPASAAKLNLGGYYEQWIGYADDNQSGNVNSFDVKQDAEFYFSFKEKLSNGLTVGGRFEMEAGQGNNHGITAGQDSGATASSTDGAGFDEASLYIQGSFGKILIGNNDVAAAYTGGASVVGPIGLIKSDAGDWLSFGSAMNNSDLDLGIGDAGNVTYWTPKMNGLQLIASYTPDASDNAIGDYDASEQSGAHNHISASLQYTGKSGGTSYKVAMGVARVENTDANGNDEESGVNFAVDIKSGATRLTVAYAKENDTADKDSWLGIGLRYKLDKTNEVSFGYGYSLEDRAVDETTKLYTLGYERKLGKGVSLAASAFYVDHDDKANGTLRNRDLKKGGIVGGVKVDF